MKKKSNINLYLILVILISSISFLSGCGASAYSKNEIVKSVMPQTSSAIAEKSYDTTNEISDTNSLTTTENVADGRKLIKTVNITLESTEFDNLISSLSAKVSELGGYIEQSDIYANNTNYFDSYDTAKVDKSNARSASIITRIPTDNLDSFIKTVEYSGNITNKSENISDVTLQYSDVESHKKSLEIEQDRLWTLLEKAEDINSIIALQTRLSEIRYQLDNYKSQLLIYDNQIDYSTVTVNINEVITYTPQSQASISSRISKGLNQTILSLKRFFTDFFVNFIVYLPIILLFIILIYIIVLIIRKLDKNISQKNKLKLELDKTSNNKSITEDVVKEDTNTIN